MWLKPAFFVYIINNRGYNRGMAERLIKNKKSRVFFLHKGEQRVFLNNVQSKLGLRLKDFSKIAGVCVRSMDDWKREKNSMSLDGLNSLCKTAKIALPKDIQIREKFWYISRAASLGGLATFKKHGGIGNKKYRKIKWLEWWENKGKFNHKQYFVEKDIVIPKKNNQLAELVGIILGDGSITENQVSVTLNIIDDLSFSYYVRKLIADLFSVKSSIYKREKESVLNIVVSRKKLVVFFLKMGLKIGSKVRQQTGVPEWVRESDIFSKFCMRGLLDTDGCFYIDKHRYKDKIYLNCGINFTNRSLPILYFFKENLIKFGYHPTQKTKFSIFLRREEEILRYFKEIGTSNPKHLNKFNRYFNNNYGGVG